MRCVIIHIICDFLQRFSHCDFLQRDLNENDEYKEDIFEALFIRNFQREIG